MLRLLSKVGRVALTHGTKVVSRSSLFKGAGNPVTKTRIFKVSAVCVVPYAAFGMPWGKKEDPGKLYHEGYEAYQAKDWKKAIDCWNKMLESKLNAAQEEEIHLLYLMLAKAMLYDGRDNLLIASTIKRYLDKIKNDDEAWKIYFGAIITGLGNQQNPNDRIEDWIELKYMATEALRSIKNPEFRQALTKLLQEPKMQAIPVPAHIAVQMFQRGMAAFQAENWKVAVDSWTQLVNMPLSPEYAERMPNIHFLLAKAMHENGEDDARIAASLKIFLDKYKNHDGPWALYIIHKVRSVERKGVRAKNEDLIELKDMAEQAVKNIKSRQTRDEVIAVLNKSRVFKQFLKSNEKEGGQ